MFLDTWSGLYSVSFFPTKQTTEQAFQHILNIVDYSRNVMKPLLGEKYVHSGVSNVCLIVFKKNSSACLITGCDLASGLKRIFECPQEVVKLPLDFVRKLSLKIQQERPGKESGANKCLSILFYIFCTYRSGHRSVHLYKTCLVLSFSISLYTESIIKIWHYPSRIKCRISDTLVNRTRFTGRISIRVQILC